MTASETAGLLPLVIIVYFRREGTTYILSIVRTKETKQ